LKVRVENWMDVDRKIRDEGIEEVTHDSDGVLRSVVLKNGDRFEFPMDIWKDLERAGLITVCRSNRLEQNRN